MNIDIIRRAKQNIMINVDLFSKFVTSCLVDSEKASDLETGIIQCTTPVRNSKTINIRVDKAKGFLSLVKTPSTNLQELGICLEIGDDENKNSNCAVDKIINEIISH